MQEREMRRILGQVCRELELRGRARRAVGAVFGTSLLVAGGCGGEFTPEPTDGGSDAADSGSAADATQDGADGGTVTPVYSAPLPEGGADIDSGAVAEYMAPIDAGPVVKYGVPEVDGGAIALYMAAEG